MDLQPLLSPMLSSRQTNPQGTREEKLEGNRCQVRGMCVCRLKKTPRARAKRGGLLGTSTCSLAGNQARFQWDSATPFHFISHSRSNEPIFLCQRGTRHHRGVQSIAAARAFQSIATSEALAAKHLAPELLPSSQKFIISDRKYTPFPWIQLWAARCRCSCTCCKGEEQDSSQTTRTESRPEQAFTIYKIII